MNILNLSHATRHTLFPGLCLFALFLFLPSLSSAQYLNQRTGGVHFKEGRIYAHDTLQYKDLKLEILYEATNFDLSCPRGNYLEAKDLTKNSKRADRRTFEPKSMEFILVIQGTNFGDMAKISDSLYLKKDGKGHFKKTYLFYEGKGVKDIYVTVDFRIDYRNLEKNYAKTTFSTNKRLKRKAKQKVEELMHYDSKGAVENRKYLTKLELKNKVE